MSRSTNRLKPIADDRANTMHATHSSSSTAVTSTSSAAIRAAASANGIANRLCDSLIIRL